MRPGSLTRNPPGCVTCLSICLPFPLPSSLPFSLAVCPPLSSFSLLPSPASLLRLPRSLLCGSDHGAAAPARRRLRHHGVRRGGLLSLSLYLSLSLSLSLSLRPHRLFFLSLSLSLARARAHYFHLPFSRSRSLSCFLPLLPPRLVFDLSLSSVAPLAVPTLAQNWSPAVEIVMDGQSAAEGCGARDVLINTLAGLRGLGIRGVGRPH
eukprot:122563-Rhodomonas_salina.1